MNNSKTILKLKKVFNMGYVPQRGYQLYYYVGQEKNYCINANCFAHACLNLTNQQIKEMGLDLDDSFAFALLPAPTTAQETEAKFIEFLDKIGLSVSRLNSNDIRNEFPGFLENNEWIVALYFCENKGFKDFHFFLQEKDGTWSGKYGYKNIVEHLDELPYKYTSPSPEKDTYYFVNKYVISNPHAKLEHTTKDEVYL